MVSLDPHGARKRALWIFVRCEAVEDTRESPVRVPTKLLACKRVHVDAIDTGTKLAHAQFSIAREHGFDSWPKLVDHVSAVNPQTAEPEIVAPVSRWLGARDVNRTVTFWTGVLGFTMSRQGETAAWSSRQAAPEFASATRITHPIFRHAGASRARRSYFSTPTMSPGCTPP
jgi:hypothetical protein